MPPTLTYIGTATNAGERYMLYRRADGSTVQIPETVVSRPTMEPALGPNHEVTPGEAAGSTRSAIPHRSHEPMVLRAVAPAPESDSDRVGMRALAGTANGAVSGGLTEPEMRAAHEAKYRALLADLRRQYPHILGTGPQAKSPANARPLAALMAVNPRLAEQSQHMMAENIRSLTPIASIEARVRGDVRKREPDRLVGLEQYPGGGGYRTFTAPDTPLGELLIKYPQLHRGR